MIRSVRLILFGWLITFCCIQSVDSTNAFIKNLLTTTPSSNHISDFRKQKRTDSRADRPDTFPGFDFHEDSPTLSPHKRRRQAYSQLIRLFLQNTRDRLETIRDVIKDESELHFRLAQPLDESNGRMAAAVAAAANYETDPMMHNAKIRFSENENTNDHDAKNRQFIDFAFADSANADETMEINGKGENISRDNAREYLNSLFAAVGYSRITATPPPPSPPSPNPNEHSGDDTAQGNIIAKYLINPLQSVWNATLERFKLNNASSDDTSSSSSVNANNMSVRTNNKTIAETASDNQTTIYRVNFVNNSDIKPKMHTNARNDMNKEPNEIRVDNFNYSLPLIQFTASNNVTMDVVPVNETTMTTTTTASTTILTTPTSLQLSKNANGMLDVDYVGADHSGSSDKKPRDAASARTSVEEDAAIAFQNAFLKYSNYMQQQPKQQMEYAKRNTTSPNIATLDTENFKFTQDNRNEMKSGKLLLLDGGIFADNSFDGMNSSHIQTVVTNKKHKTNGSLSESVSVANSVDDNSTELNAKSFGENAGILILEIFGTIVGMTWRAVNNIPSYIWARVQQTTT